jgi:hypothetical protein
MKLRKILGVLVAVCMLAGVATFTTSADVSFPLVFDLAAELAEINGDEDGYMQKSGSPTLAIEGGGLKVSGRDADWHTVDVRIGFLPDGVYKLVVNFEAATAIQFGFSMAASPWSGYVTADAATSATVDFIFEMEDGKGTNVQGGERIRLRSTCTSDYTIKSIVIEEFEAPFVQGEDFDVMAPGSWMSGWVCTEALAEYGDDFTILFNVKTNGTEQFRVRYSGGVDKAGGFTNEMYNDGAGHSTEAAIAVDGVANQVPAFFNSDVGATATLTVNFKLFFDVAEITGDNLGFICLLGGGGGDDYELVSITILDANGLVLGYGEYVEPGGENGENGENGTNGGENGENGTNGGENGENGCDCGEDDCDDCNPPTGVALAIVPALVAAAALVVTRKRK